MNRPLILYQKTASWRRYPPGLAQQRPNDRSGRRAMIRGVEHFAHRPIEPQPPRTESAAEQPAVELGSAALQPFRDEFAAILDGSESLGFAPSRYRKPVEIVQRALARLGYLDGPVDGLYGRGTERAVARWQRDAGLEPTGVIDAASLAQLDRALGETSSSSPEAPTTAPDTQSAIFEAKLRSMHGGGAPGDPSIAHDPAALQRATELRVAHTRENLEYEAFEAGFDGEPFEYGVRYTTDPDGIRNLARLALHDNPEAGVAGLQERVSSPSFLSRVPEPARPVWKEVVEEQRLAASLQQQAAAAGNGSFVDHGLRTLTDPVDIERFANHLGALLPLEAHTILTTALREGRVANDAAARDAWQRAADRLGPQSDRYDPTIDEDDPYEYE
ncbi:MAG: hypothetical protein D6776_11090 [Planctomycetota bacterium]|nr:MAG: hypothetical protein D6776_11090 [Planctomycetota bacterium]